MEDEEEQQPRPIQAPYVAPKTRLTRVAKWEPAESSTEGACSDSQQQEEDSTLAAAAPVPALAGEAAVEETEPTTPSSPSKVGGARDQWGKTVDKIKMIANIQTVPEQGRDVDMSPSLKTSLAPFYPPVFEPSFIALSRDEYGRKLPPIILPMISVAVTDSEYMTRGSQWVFRTELQYGDIKWVIRRTIADFVTLHYTLKLKSSLSDYVPAPPQFPDQLRSLISSARTTIGLDRKDDENADFNEGNETEGEKKEIALTRRVALTIYLRALLSKAHMLVSYDICEFFEVSAVSIFQDMGWKGKEGFLENRVRNSNPNMCHFWQTHRWNKEWVLLRDSYIAFCDDIAAPGPSDVLLLDNTFQVRVTQPSYIGSYHMTLSTLYREIEIKGSRREVDEWMDSIERVKKDSPWVKNHRFSSFAPVRHKAKVKWFVDGENHMNAVAEAILSAKSEIYIADWWLTPELYLRRPPEKNQEFRIDRLLQRKAKEGVMVYIIVYKEMSLALTIDSAHTKKWLQGLHPNIIVQRHPDRRAFDNNSSIFFWSHHEKLVVVDNRLAFIGGIDLCFGRFDTHAHRNADYPAKGHQYKMFPGQDYSSPRVKDFSDVANHDTSLVDREEIPRMPWHDMSCAVVGPIARDAARLFIQRWNYLKTSKSGHRNIVPFLMPKGEYVALRDESNFEGTCRVQLLRSCSSWSSGIEREHSIYNAYLESIIQAKYFIYIENQFFISATGEDKIVRNKIGQALVDRIKRAHYNNEKFKVFILIPLIPAFEGDLTTGDSLGARGVMHFQYISMSRGGNSICEKLREEGIDPGQYIGWYSLRNWDKIVPRIPRMKRRQKKRRNGNMSPAAPPAEEGAPGEGGEQNDHLKVSSGHQEDLASLSSKSSAGGTSDVSAGEEEEEQQLEEEQDGRDHYVSELVYIHDKLMIVDDRIVLIGSANINDRSLLGNRDSEMAVYIEDTEMIPSYMDGKEYQAAKFAHTLRMQLWKEHLGLLDFHDWDVLMDQDDDDALQTCATEGIGYDTVAAGTGQGVAVEEGLTATANGDDGVNNNIKLENEYIRDCERDEVARIIDRVSRTRSIFDKYRHHMKHDHDQEHLKEAQALDPLADRCYYNIWRKTANANTLVYRDVFRCVPDDTVRNFDEHRKFVPDANQVAYGHVADPERTAEDIQQTLDGVRGHLVEFPVDYLKDETLLNTFESMAPMIIFT
ncbi:hypothetical protein BDB00DRAFT_837407 [Zychaea mexicana]|uniref:uncharacterized protein n=1 Tax=Zychaea mexicana TaxID=64656 RepID=UPI0022FDEA5F|nr:uncharacterized protein BDB00DRAFT_837407 [Zychaea mexicana]KAI9490490.1 hypothetical protein BDB00DRAFT_837407 [Zychaea mexicana]